MKYFVLIIYFDNYFALEQVFAESKDEVSLILFGTAGTANHLAKNGQYEYITEARPMAPVDLDLIRYVKKEITPGPASADCILLLILIK